MKYSLKPFQIVTTFGSYATAPINKVLKLFDPTRANYDPETMALFHDVAFLEITGG